MKYRDKLDRTMAGPIPFWREYPANAAYQADYKARRELKTCLSEFHRIL